MSETRYVISLVYLVQVDAPEVQALGVVAQDALKDAAAAVRAALVELYQRRLTQHLQQSGKGVMVVEKEAWP